MIKFFKNLWMKIKYPKKVVRIPEVGDKRIHGGEAQMLIRIQWTPKDGFTEFWEDLIKHIDMIKVINCPRCQHTFTGGDVYHGAEQ